MKQGIQASISIISRPDIEMCRRLYQLEGLDASGVVKAVSHLQKQRNGSEQLPLFLEQIVAIVLCHQQQHDWVYHIFEADAEKTLLTDFHQYVNDKMVTLFAWQGNVRDFPLLHYRLLKHSLPRIEVERCVDIEADISPFAESTKLSLHEAVCLFGLDEVDPILLETIERSFSTSSFDELKQHAESNAKLIMQIVEKVKQSR